MTANAALKKKVWQGLSQAGSVIVQAGEPRQSASSICLMISILSGIYDQHHQKKRGPIFLSYRASCLLNLRLWLLALSLESSLQQVHLLCKCTCDGHVIIG